MGYNPLKAVKSGFNQARLVHFAKDLNKDIEKHLDVDMMVLDEFLDLFIMQYVTRYQKIQRCQQKEALDAVKAMLVHHLMNMHGEGRVVVNVQQVSN